MFYLLEHGERSLKYNLQDRSTIKKFIFRTSKEITIINDF